MKVMEEKSHGRPALDVSHLPTVVFGNRGLVWWGTLGMMAIEGTVFAIAIAVYFYLRTRTNDWPPNTNPPPLLWGTLDLIVILVSIIPNHLAKKSAEKMDLRRARLWLIVLSLGAFVIAAIRLLEFPSLNTRLWENAYGSITVTLLGLHTLHLFTDLADTIVLATLFFTGPLSQKRFVDAAENSDYWYFVVGSWIPIYVVIYWAPRWI